MTTKSIAASACPVKPKGQYQSKTLPQRWQRGVTLLELMVGITIGLLVIAVATGTLMVSRGVSGTVSDASNIQQQAAYAMRVIGLQLRQAGSLQLNLNSSSASTQNILEAPVAFETEIEGPGKANDFSLSDSASLLNQTGKTLTIGYRRAKESVFTSANLEAVARNCVGVPKDASDDQRVESIFEVDLTTHTLKCGGNGAASQDIIRNVANGETRYMVQDVLTTPGDAIIKTATAAEVTTAGDWPRVQAVEVCLVLYGTEAIDMPAGSSYLDCDGTTKIDMTKLTGERAKRIHLVFRNVFQLRGQGLAASVL